MKRLILVASVVIPITLIGLLLSSDGGVTPGIGQVRDMSSQSSSAVRATEPLTLTEQIYPPFARRNSPPAIHVPDGEYLLVEYWTHSVLGVNCAGLCIDFPTYHFNPQSGELTVYLPESALVLDEDDIGYIGSGESLGGVGSGATSHLTRTQSCPLSIDGITLRCVDETATITIEHESEEIVLEADEAWVSDEETEVWDWLGAGCVVTSTDYITNYAFQYRDKITYIWPFQVFLPVVVRNELLFTHSSFPHLLPTGRRTVNLVPSPTTLSAVMVPPWASTISFVIASPNPAPRLRRRDLSAW